MPYEPPPPQGRSAAAVLLPVGPRRHDGLVAGLTLARRAALTLRQRGPGPITLVGAPPRPEELAGTDALVTPAGGSVELPAGPTLLVADDLVVEGGALGRLLEAAVAAEAPLHAVDPQGAPIGLAVLLRPAAGPVAVDELRATLAARPGRPWPLDGWWARTDGTPGADRRAQRVILTAVRKRPGGLIAQLVNRYVSIEVTRLLLPYPVTPNHVTYFGALLAAAAVALMFLPGWAMGVWAAVLYQLQSILDGTDGEIARIKHQSSPFGAWLDQLLDDASLIVFMIAMGRHEALGRGEPRWLWAGVACGVGAALWNCADYHARFVLGDNFRFWWEQGRSLTVRYRSRSPLTWLKYASRRDFYVFAVMWLAIADQLWIALALNLVTVVVIDALVFTHVAVKRAPW